MRYLTDFADQAVILPLVLAVAVALAVQGWRRGALVWLVVVAGVFFATLTSKVMFLACSPLFGPIDVHSPSGHVAAATVVTGGLAAMFTRRRASILPAAVLAAIVIGVSRLVLGMHSLPEVVVGAMIGLAGAVALLRFAGTPPLIRVAPLVLVVVVVAGGVPRAASAGGSGDPPHRIPRGAVYSGVPGYADVRAGVAADGALRPGAGIFADIRQSTEEAGGFRRSGALDAW